MKNSKSLKDLKKLSLLKTEENVQDFVPELWSFYLLIRALRL